MVTGYRVLMEIIVFVDPFYHLKPEVISISKTFFFSHNRLDFSEFLAGSTIRHDSHYARIPKYPY